MEKIKTAAMVIAAGGACGFALAACDMADEDTAIVQRDGDGQKTGLVIFTDRDTGCQYVRTLRRDGITPRLNKDGTPKCV